MKTNITNRVAEIRKSRGLGASDLARRVEVSRQTIYAIEGGTYVPNTEVALRIAQELEVSIDELFQLGEHDQKTPDSLLRRSSVDRPRRRANRSVSARSAHAG